MGEAVLLGPAGRPHEMPQEMGLPDGSESEPHAGRLSLPPKKREMRERKAVAAEAGPGQPIPCAALGTVPAALLQPCLRQEQRGAAEALPKGPTATPLSPCPPKPLPGRVSPCPAVAAGAEVQQPRARSALPGRARDAGPMPGAPDGAAPGCAQQPGISAAPGPGAPPRHAVAWVSLGGRAGGLGPAAAPPGAAFASRPAVSAGAEGADRTEPGWRPPMACAAPARAQLYYGLAAPVLAAGADEPAGAGAKPSLRPPGGGEQKPPADIRDVPAVPPLMPARLSAPVVVSLGAPSCALLYSRPLGPAVGYSQRQSPCRAEPAPAGGVWSMLLPTASTAFVLPHFQRGSLTALPGGERKRVEELRMEDFLRCAASSPELHISSCVVEGIRSSPHAGFASLQVYLREQDRQVSADVLREYPFFARGRGWVSCCPRTTSQLYQLPCQQLAVGDVCMVWSLRAQSRDAPGARREPRETPRGDAEL